MQNSRTYNFFEVSGHNLESFQTWGFYVYGFLKGTQEWEFFRLRFWILYYFIVSYIKILRFCKKKLFDWASIGRGMIFPRSPRTTWNEKKFWARSKKYFFIFLFMNPLYELILVFSKFHPLTAPGVALCVNLGPKCQNLFCFVWN